jgi:NAD(P)-dependent dehydrogenase (short-subunit alcohol dehydrogenase family)
MRVLITGASGYIATALTDRLADDHELVLSDLEPMETPHEFVQADVREPAALREAVEGVDAVVHTPAWHGVHVEERTEREFWEVNVEGTFNLFDAAAQAGVDHVVWLSSQAWYGGTHDRYCFTKVVGEQTCEYFADAHDMRVLAIRPAAVDDPHGGGPTGVETRKEFGEALAGQIVSRRDVVGVTETALNTTSIEWGAYPALRSDPFTRDDAAAWEDDPVAVLESYVPRAGELLDRYDLDVPEELNRCGGHEGATMAPSGEDLGFEGRDTIVTFLESLAARDQAGEAEAWLANELDRDD